MQAELLHLGRHSIPVELLGLDEEVRFVYLLDELSGAFALRMVEELVGGAILIDDAIGKE